MALVVPALMRSERSTLVVLVAVLLASSFVRPGEGVDSDNAISEHAKSFSDKPVSAFTETITASQLPLPVLVYDDSAPDAVANVWKPFVKQMGQVLHGYGLTLGYATARSETGKLLLSTMRASPPTLLLFDGVLRPLPDRAQNYGKVPTAYQGKFDVGAMIRWVLEGISPDLITRVDSHDDLTYLFAKYPRYPTLPRILYIAKSDYVSPLVRILSQHYLSDAVFGTLLRPFETPAKAAVAARYGVTEDTTLPALLVLTPTSGSNSDRVVMLDGVNGESTVRQLVEKLHEALPDSTLRVVQRETEAGRPVDISPLQARKLYVLQEVAHTQEVLFGEATESLKNSQASGAPPVLVHSQQEWELHCAKLPPGHNCLAVFAETAESEKVLKTIGTAQRKILQSISASLAGAVHFVVVDRDRSADIQTYFNAGQNGYPDVVLLTTAAPRTYYNFVGSFSVDSLVRFYLSKTQTRKPVGGSRYSARKIPALGVRSDSHASAAAEEADL